jgi:hypothetical protein
MSLTKLEIINYSEHAFAVVGESTKALKEDLMALGGKYNRNLKCGAGWIFPLKALESVTSFLEKKVVKKDLSDISSSSEEETKDSKDAKASKASKEVKASKSLKPDVITPNPAKDTKTSKDTKASKDSKDAKPSQAPKTVAKKVVLSDSDSDSEEEQVKLKPVKSSKASKASKASKVSKHSDSDSSDDEKDTPHVSYEEYTRVTRELESARKKVELLQENLSKLQIRFLDCEEDKNIAVKKYKTLKAKVKESKKTCENVGTNTEFEEPGRVESHDDRDQEEEESRPTICVSM